MGFKILTATGEALTIHALDVEAANFWKKPVDPKWYATPFTFVYTGIDDVRARMKASMEFHSKDASWFDKIGWVIHFNKCTTWTEVIDVMMKPFSDPGVNAIIRTDEYYGLYLKLIWHWEAKGYIPVPVAD